MSHLICSPCPTMVSVVAFKHFWKFWTAFASDLGSRLGFLQRDCLLLNYSITVEGFWATVCKTVCPMLSVRCLSVCPVCLSVTLVYCGQTVRWIKMKLGTEVWPRPRLHFLDAGQLTSHTQRGTAPNFRPMSVVAKQLVGSRCHLIRM